MGGGGARAAYQAGVLRYIADAFPSTAFSILTGVSAGAINAAQMANQDGSFGDATDALLRCWQEITAENVYRFEEPSRFGLLWNFIRRGDELGEGFMHGKRGMLDTAPLRQYLVDQLGTVDGRLAGVAANLRNGALEAVAIITTNYMTGQTVSWVQGRNIALWERPNRISIRTDLTVDHIMASAALPLLFPAIRLDDCYYGDGGIRLSSPLSPAVHLGADRILAISTRYDRSRTEADEPSTAGYPPAAQIIGILMNAIFLDALEEDALVLERINRLAETIPARKRGPFRPLKVLILRPSVDLGKLSGQYDVRLPEPLQLLTSGLGTGETRSPDWLSMLLFQRDYLTALIEIGYEDARRNRDRLAAFFDTEEVLGTAGERRFNGKNAAPKDVAAARPTT